MGTGEAENLPWAMGRKREPRGPRPAGLVVWMPPPTATQSKPDLYPANPSAGVCVCASGGWCGLVAVIACNCQIGTVASGRLPSVDQAGDSIAAAAGGWDLVWVGSLVFECFVCINSLFFCFFASGCKLQIYFINKKTKDSTLSMSQVPGTEFST